MHQEKPPTLLRDALSWLTRTAMTKDIRDIKRRVIKLIEMQTQQQDNLVHVIFILYITRYAMACHQTIHQCGHGSSLGDTQ